jgi:hypothetical protein
MPSFDSAQDDINVSLSGVEDFNCYVFSQNP